MFFYDLIARDKSGWTLIIVACNKGQEDVVQKLD